MDEAVIDSLYPRAHKLLGIVALLVAVAAAVSNAAHPRATDFLAFWAAAGLALHGDAATAYVPAALTAAERIGAASAGGLPFGYPPAFLLVMLPGALLPYGAAALAWIVASGLAFIKAARAMLPRSGWLAVSFPPVAVNAMIGQNGLLTAALTIAAALTLPRRPLLAGILAGGLVIKPQLAILYPLAFLLGRQWRAVVGAALSATALSVAALIAFRVASYVAFLRALPLFASVAAGGLTGWHKVASVYGALRLAGLDSGAAWTVHIAVAIAAATVVAVIWRGGHALPAKFAALIAASMLISPYLYVYDTAALIVPFFWLAERGADRRVLAMLWLLPLPSVLQNWSADPWLNPMPLLPVALLTMVALELRSGRQAAKSLPNG